MQRYFVKNNQIHQKSITIFSDDAIHIGIIMRMKINDQVIVCDEFANSYLCEIASISKQQVILSIIHPIDHNPELPIDVTIAQGLIRREKTEEVIQKITELGASCYIPLTMERSIVKIVKEQEEKKLERYHKIAKEASEQSHRTKIPSIKKAMSIKELILEKGNYDLCLFAYEEMGRSNDTSLPILLSKFRGNKLLVVIGPEGGFSKAEVDLLSQAGFISIGLGPRILRTETAPQYVMSVISYQFELGEVK